MLCTWPGGKVVAAFSDQLQGEVRTKTVCVHRRAASKLAADAADPSWNL
jgi:hypothetical protein